MLPVFVGGIDEIGLPRNRGFSALPGESEPDDEDRCPPTYVGIDGGGRAPLSVGDRASADANIIGRRVMADPITAVGAETVLRSSSEIKFVLSALCCLPWLSVDVMAPTYDCMSTIRRCTVEAGLPPMKDVTSDSTTEPSFSPRGPDLVLATPTVTVCADVEDGLRLCRLSV